MGEFRLQKPCSKKGSNSAFIQDAFGISHLTDIDYMALDGTGLPQDNFVDFPGI